MEGVVASGDGPLARFSFETTVIHWRGPSPWFYAPVPAAASAEIRRLARLVTHGWGMIPVEATIGGAAFRTALFPRDETYLLPLKAAVRRQAAITAGDSVTVEMTIRAAER